MLAAGALLAAYPHHVDAVAWISSRSDLLAALFGLGALGCYLSSARLPRAAGPVLLLFAVLSKESAFVLALLPWIAGAARRRKLLPRDALPYLAVAAAAGLARLLSAGLAGAERVTSPLSWPVNAAASAAWLLLPLDGEWLQDAAGRVGIATLIAVLAPPAAALLWWALRARPGRELLLRGLSLTGPLLLLPALAGVRARYLYLPSLVLIPALGAWAAARFLPGPRRRGRAIALVLVLLAGGLAGARARQRAWAGASELSERFLESLAIAAHANPGGTLYVLAAPFTLRGASVAASWTKALRLAYDVRADVRVLNTLRVPDAGWDALRWTVPAPGVVRQSLAPGAHAAFHHPGEAGGPGPVRLRDATVTLRERDARGRVSALEVALDAEPRQAAGQVWIALGGRLRSPWP